MKRRAFTLVELLVVISIIGLLSSIAAVSMYGSRDKAKIAAGRSFDQSVRNGLGDQLMGEWTLEGGAATDVSGNGNNGVLSGTYSAATGQDGGGAIYFSSGMASTPLDVQPSVMPSVTFSAWIKPDPFAASQTVMGDDDGGYDRTVECGRGGNNLFNIFTGAGTWTPTICDAGVWQHIAVAYTPTNIYFYKNGVRFVSNIVPVNGGTTSNFTFGSWPGGAERFHGVIDDVRVYATALGLSQIEKLYADSLPAHRLAAAATK